MRRLVHGRSPAELRKLRFVLGSSLAADGGGADAGAGAAGARLTVRHADFEEALRRTQPSVSAAQARRHDAWEREFAAS
jgi:hypothetical protein